MKGGLTPGSSLWEPPDPEDSEPQSTLNSETVRHAGRLPPGLSHRCHDQVGRADPPSTPGAPLALLFTVVPICIMLLSSKFSSI